MINLEVPQGEQRCRPTSLVLLRIENCNRLTSISVEMLESCKSLRRLKVKNCPNLVSFPFGSLTSSEHLAFGYPSSEIDLSGLISLSALHELELHGLPHIESLPDQIQFITNLTILDLRNFGIEALPNWIKNPASLEELYLCVCKKFRYLPSMDAMKCLTKLRYH